MTKTFNSQSGSAIIYILIAIALLGALTASLLDSPSQQTQSQNRMKTLADMKSQINLIRAAVDECILVNHRGDSGIDSSGGAMDEGANKRYPIRPDSDHFTGATVGAAADRLVRHIRCPGNPGDDNNHALIFSGLSAKFLPPAPDLFSDWQWYNGLDGVFFWTSTTNTDSFITSALEKLDDEFGECEADVIDATSGAVDMVSDTGGNSFSCASGSTCFRVWIILKSTALHQDAGCP
ncbi:MAG: hypothetical protein H6857_04075 [Rhodospirillales bacterium]|nr:hypothetical protein [Rhodospirillales bacterium]